MHLQLLFLLSLLPFSISYESPGFTDCGEPLKFHCGSHSLNISYPFNAGGRPEYCGFPGHRITCDGNKTTFQLDGGTYLVKGIDYTHEVLTLAETKSIEGGSCPVGVGNTSFNNLPLFDLKEDNEALSLLRCRGPPPLRYEELHTINCSTSNESGWRWYYCTFQRDVPLPPSCEGAGKIWLHRTAVEQLKGGCTSFWAALSRGFDVEWKAGKGWCRDCLHSGGVCRRNSSQRSPKACFCHHGTWGKSCGLESMAPIPPQDPAGPKGIGPNIKRRLVLIACGASLLGLIVSTIALCLYLRKRKCNRYHPSRASLEDFLVAQGPLGLNRCSYKEVRQMTDKFSTKLGNGGFGSVFKGMLNNNGKLIPVAVKLLRESKGSGEDFVNEVASIGTTNHVNVVPLLGFCLQGSKRALIYEFMPNGSLDKYIFTNNQSTTNLLGWEQLYKIALGIARGLEYLHRGCRNRIVHFDIKPHNILLDEDFCPKISDFGLAKLCPKQESFLSMECARGTIGYIAPEVFSKNFGVVSSKADVYSYGMMVLEMAGGRRNSDNQVEKSSEAYFPHWVYEHLNRGDLLACGVTPERREAAKKMMIVGLWCIQTNPSCRPSIGRVVEMLEGSVENLEIPPKPYICSPTRSKSNTNICSHQDTSTFVSHSQ